MDNKFDLDLDNSKSDTNLGINDEIIPEITRKQNLGTMLPINGQLKPIDALTKLDLLDWARNSLPYKGEALNNLLEQFTKRCKLETLEGKESFFNLIVSMNVNRAILGAGPIYQPEETRQN